MDRRKAELFLNNARAGDNGGAFVTAELVRQVSQAAQSGYVYDYEIVTEYSPTGSSGSTVSVRYATSL